VIAAESALLLGSAGGLAALPAAAETWRLTPSVNVRETYTTNANLAPSGQAESSFVTTVGAGVAVNGNGARANLNGSVSVQGNYYSADIPGNNASDNVYVRANLLGSLEAIEKFLFIEGAINVSQQYLSPFAPTPASTIGITNNRYTSAGYRVSPYIRGVFPGGTTYLLRSDSIWSNLGQVQNAPGATSSFTQRWSGRLDSPVRTFGWSLDGLATTTSFSNQQQDVSNQIVRGYLNWRPDAQVLLYAIGGYEWNDYYLTQSNNVVYGAGGEWRPTDRTDVRGNWQERFFGSEYLAAVTHRNPFSAFNLNASQNISTFPQQIFAAPAGGDIASLVNAAFTTRIPDPVQRAQAVEQFLATSGLPATLQSPLNYYVQQVFLYEQQSATFTLLGVRNSAALTLYNRKQEVISGGTGAVLPPPFGQLNNNTQRGGAVTLSHKLTPLTSLNATATRYQTTSLAPFSSRSTTNAVALTVGTRIAPNTDGFGGLTYTDFESNVANDYDAYTAYVGLNHRF
jgi:uncharacterized protein (PEP-CTERM system associated)